MIELLIRQHFKEFRACRILDVGPGYSSFSRLTARLTGATFIKFLDCDQSVLNFQAAECAKANIGFECVSISLDKDNLSEINERFDIIHVQEVLEHLSNADEVLVALRGLLGSGGRMIVTVPTKFSERWLTFINPSYMKDEPHGHVQQFDREGISKIIRKANLSILAFIPTQPHYFLGHTWLFGTRTKVRGSTGSIVGGGIRMKIFGIITRWSRKVFLRTSPQFWGRIIPRNYFIVVGESSPDSSRAQKD